MLGLLDKSNTPGHCGFLLANPQFEIDVDYVPYIYNGLNIWISYANRNHRLTLAAPIYLNLRSFRIWQQPVKR